MKNKPSLTESVKKSFEKSFGQVKHNQEWFNTHSLGISQWVKKNSEQEKEKEKTTPKVITEPPTTTPVQTSKPDVMTTPKPSSAPTNVKNLLVILPTIVLAMLIKTYIL